MVRADEDMSTRSNSADKTDHIVIPEILSNVIHFLDLQSLRPVLECPSSEYRALSMVTILVNISDILSSQAHPSF